MLQKAVFVLEYEKTNSVTLVQRLFIRKYGKPAPTKQSVYEWIKKFQETGCLCKGKRTGTPPVSEETVERVRETLTRSPRKSTTRASLELQMAQQTVWKILQKPLRMIPYKLQFV